jgi:hypothetical protein
MSQESGALQAFLFVAGGSMIQGWPLLLYES